MSIRIGFRFPYSSFSLIINSTNLTWIVSLRLSSCLLAIFISKLYSLIWSKNSEILRISKTNASYSKLPEKKVIFVWRCLVHLVSLWWLLLLRFGFGMKCVWICLHRGSWVPAGLLEETHGHDSRPLVDCFCWEGPPLAHCEFFKNL